MLRTELIFVFSLLVFGAAHGAVINEITPRYGSVVGGTLITIRGEGFNRAGVEGRTDVLIGNFPCVVEPYWSSDTQLVCYTPKMQGTSSARVSVFLIAISSGKSGSAECRTDCTFYYGWDRTPYLQYLDSSAASEGTLMFAGYRLSASAAQYEVKINDEWCVVDEEVFPPNVNDWGQGSVTCRLSNLTAGIYNTSIAIQNDAGAGLAMMSRSLTRATFENQTFNVEVFPRVNLVSANSGGALGGDLLTITGSGFDAQNPANNAVKVGGVDCTLVSVTSSQILCEAGDGSSVATAAAAAPAPAASPANGTAPATTSAAAAPSRPTAVPGTRGLTRRIWRGTWIGFDQRSSGWPRTVPSVETVLTNGLAASSAGDSYSQELSGFFIPPRTGKYSFYLLADDWAELFLATTPDGALESQCTVPSYSGSYYQFASQRSSPVTLQGGVAYPIRVIHQEGGWDDYVRVAVREIDVPNMSDNQKQYMSVLPQQSVDLVTSVRREQQQLWIEGANNGTFRVSVTGGFSSDSISFAEALNVGNGLMRDKIAAGLNKAKACSSISVSGPSATGANTAAAIAAALLAGDRLTWTVTFQCATFTPHPVLEVVNVGLRAPEGSSARPSFGASRTVTASKPLSGTFKLDLGGKTTVELQYNADGSTVEAALEGLEGVRDVTVSQSGNGMDSRSYTILFNDPPGAQPALRVVSVSLDGEELSTTVTVAETGKIDDMILDPVPSSYLRTQSFLPPIVVSTNGRLASCNGTNCVYAYQSGLTPSVTNVELVSPAVAGQVAEGETIRVTGTGFSDAAAGNNFVRLGGGAGSSTGCAVTSATATQLTCRVSGAVSGTFTPEVIVYGVGKARNAAGVADVTVRRTFRAVSPSRGSLGGGSTVTIAGTGFPLTLAAAGSLKVEFGAVGCDLVSVSNQAIVCTTKAPAAGTGAVSVRVDGQATGVSFEFSMAVTPVISTVAPLDVSSGLSSRITITGTFPAAPGYSVKVAGRECVMREQTATSIVCLLRRGTPPDQSKRYVPEVLAQGFGLGLATNPSSVGIDVALRVTDITPRAGSIAGGAFVTITGAGFDPNYFKMSTYLYMFYRDPTREEDQRTRCEPVTVEFNKMVCKTYGHPPPHPAGGVDVATRFDVRVSNVSAVCTDCSYTFSAASTPTVTSISPVKGLGGSSLTLSGSNLGAASPKVTVGGADCVVTASSGSSITCTLPSLPAGQANIIVSFPSVGNAFVTDGTFFEFDLSFTRVVPSVGSAQGGTTVTIFGRGMNSNATVQFGSSSGVLPARIVSVNEDSIVVLSPAEYGVRGTSESRPITVSQTKVRSVGRRDMRYEDVLPGFQDSFESSPPDVSTVTATCSTSDCAFSVNGSVSATLTTASVSGSATSTGPASVKRGDVLTLSGNGFVDSRNNSYVTIGGVGCEVLTWSDSSITCRVGAVAAGEYPVLVFVDGKGVARYGGSGFSTPNRPITVVSTLTVSASSGALEGSFAGGRSITLSGQGFSATNTSVQICGARCAVTAASYDSVTCTVPALVTEMSARTFNLAQDAPLPVGATFGSGGGNYAAAFDGSLESIFGTSAASGCSAGFSLPVGLSGVVSKIRFYPVFKRNAAVKGGKFQASADGATYFDLYVVPETPLSSWSEVDPDFSAVPAAARTALRYFRYAGADGSSCLIGEVQFVGLAVADGVSGTSADVSCPVSVSVRDVSSRFPLPSAATVPVQTQTSPSSFNYKSSLTPYITSITPSVGTALGGTMVTIGGSGLAAATSVKVMGYDCTVGLKTATAIVCTTTRRTNVLGGVAAASVASPDGASGIAKGAKFRYLDRWSALTTWRYNEPPVEGDTVIIPEGQAVILDESPPILFMLLVQGELVFDPNADGLHLQATYILVHGGKMEIGTEDTPYLNRATITLHGDKFRTIELPDAGSKMLAVSNREPGLFSPDAFNILQVQYFNPAAAKPGPGIGPNTRVGMLDIHGRPRKRVWTYVAQTAAAGSKTIVAAEDVDYEAGETILITSGDQDFTHAEERIVASLGADKRTITVTEALTYNHDSNVYQIEGRRVDARVQVGLLSRNIVIQGAPGSEAQKFGAHTVCLMRAQYRIENAEVRRCGQAGNKGRYCVHWHMGGPQSESYARSNSIHHSFQRAVTIHGTNYLRVQRNFAYNVAGHTVFVEDGGEAENVIEENLVVWTYRSYVMLKSDTKPASFWTSTPRNYWRHNVAGGCTNDGYWLELSGRPGGPSAYMPFCPLAEHLGEHFNNTAHSNGVHGLRIYPIYLPQAVPCDASSGPSPQYFYRFNSWRNGNNGIFGRRNGDLHHVDATLHENGGEELLWTMYLRTVYTNDPAVKNLLAIGSYDASKPKQWAAAVWAPQDEYWYADGITFVNYATGAIKGCAKCDDQTMLKQGGYTFRFRNLKFTNTPKRVEFTRPFKQIFWDLDGTLTGSANSFLTPARKWLEDPMCRVQDDTVYNNGTICTGVAVRRLQIDNVEPRELDFKPVMLSRPETTPAGSFGIVGFLPKEIYGWAIPVLANRDLNLDFYNPATNQRHPVDWRSMRIRWSEPDYIVAGEWQRITMQHIDWRWQYQVKTGAGELRPWLLEGTKPESTADFGTGAMGAAYVNGQRPPKFWTVVISTKNVTATGYPAGDWGKGQEEYISDSFTMNVNALQCAPGMKDCSIPDDVPLGDKKMWSDPKTWSTGEGDPGRVPGVGEDVEIKAGQYVVMDINPPRLGAVRIWGKLEFLDTQDRNLDCDSIVVGGILQVGQARTPFQHKAAITLYGDRYSKTVIVDDSLFLGNKMMVVIGRAELHGKFVETSWTRLGATAEVGATSLVFADPVDWAVGDELVVGTTDYNREHTEYVKIAAISQDKKTVTIDQALKYRHFSGRVTAGTKVATLAAPVGHLSRNVVFRGFLEPNAEMPMYGAHLVVADLPNKNKKGSVAIRHVRFENTGKLSMEHASILFKYQRKYTQPPRPFTSAGVADVAGNGTVTAGASSVNSDESMPNNLVEGCAFANSFNYGVVGEGAQAIRVYRNVFSRAFRSCIDLDADSTNVELLNNLITNVNQTPDETKDWVRPIAGIFLQYPPKVLAGNVVAGSSDAGFTIRPPSCTADVIGDGNSGNEAIGCHIGMWVLPGGDYQGCSLIDSFTAWKSTHMGLTTVDQDSDLSFRNLVLTDNHIGLELNFFYSNSRAKISMDGAIIAGNTAATVCTESLDCAAVSVSDYTGETCGSVLGTSYGRVGMLLPQFGNRGKTCERDYLPRCRPPNTPERLCGMGWDARYGLPPTVHALLEMKDVVFSNFQPQLCGKTSVAMMLHPDQPDYTPVTRMSRVQWDSVDPTAQFDLSKEHRECVTGCDAHMSFFIEDVDGTVTGSNGRTFVVPNQQLSEASAACSEKSHWHSSICTLQYVQGTLESLDDDRGGRRIGPMHVDRMLEGQRDVKSGTSIAVGPFNDNCAKRFHFGQFPIVLVPGRHHVIIPSGSMPASSRLWFHTDDASQAATVSIFFTKPSTLVVYADGVRNVNRSVARPVTLNDPAGTYVQDPQNRYLNITVRGGVRQYTIRTLPLVQISLSLAVSVNEFYGDRLVEHMSTLLKIDPSTIKVVDVQPGSARVSVEIGDSRGASANDTEFREIVTGLQTVAKQLVSKAEQGSLNVGYPVLTMQVDAPKTSLSQTNEDLGIPTGAFVPAKIDFGSSGLPAGAIVGIVLAALAIIGLAGAFIYQRRRTHASFNVESVQNEAMGRGFRSNSEVEEGLAERELPHQRGGPDDWEDDEAVVGVVRAKGDSWASRTVKSMTTAKNRKVGIEASEEDAGDMEMSTAPLKSVGGKVRKVNPEADEENGLDDPEAGPVVTAPSFKERFGPAPEPAAAPRSSSNKVAIDFDDDDEEPRVETDDQVGGMSGSVRTAVKSAARRLSKMDENYDRLN